MKIAFLEAGCGWLPYMMDRLDYEYETRGARSFPNMKKKPSDYVKDCPVYVSCEPEEHSSPMCRKSSAPTASCFPPIIRMNESTASS